MESIQDQLNNAIRQASLNDVAKLLSAGASPNEPNSEGWTPLMQAAECSDIDILKLLLQAGADVMKRGCGGITCLHVAVDSAIDGTIQNDSLQGEEPIEIIEILLNNGTDIFAQDERGKTPLDWAREYKSAKIIRLLEEHV